MLNGETIASGAPNACPDCKTKLKNKVMRSAAGFYIGTQCKCGPYSRESHYFGNNEAGREAAEKALAGPAELYERK